MIDFVGVSTLLITLLSSIQRTSFEENDPQQQQQQQQRQQNGDACQTTAATTATIGSEWLQYDFRWKYVNEYFTAKIFTYTTPEVKEQ